MTADASKIEPRRRGPLLAVLTFVYVLNFLDRQLLGILAKRIQDTLRITDGRLALIGGFYFALLYSFIAVPVGWYADRRNRVAMVSLARAVRSAATTACGLAATYPQLVAARMVVGFGGWIAATFDWRLAFVALGVVGIVTAVLVRVTVREPARGGLDERSAEKRDGAPFWGNVRMFVTSPVLMLAALARAGSSRRPVR